MIATASSNGRKRIGSWKYDSQFSAAPYYCVVRYRAQALVSRGALSARLFLAKKLFRAGEQLLQTVGMSLPSKCEGGIPCRLYE